MIKTFGLTHVAIAVSEPERSFRFYEQVIGAKLLASLEGRESDDLHDQDVIEFGTPGCHDVIVVVRSEDGTTGETGDLKHFGFRLVSEEDPGAISDEIERAGGSVLDKGRFKSSGAPYVFARDPDGYEIEFWFETQPAWR